MIHTTGDWLCAIWTTAEMVGLWYFVVYLPVRRRLWRWLERSGQI